MVFSGAAFHYATANSACACLYAEYQQTPVLASRGAMWI